MSVHLDFESVKYELSLHFVYCHIKPFIEISDDTVAVCSLSLRLASSPLDNSWLAILHVAHSHLPIKVTHTYESFESYSTVQIDYM